MKAATNGNQQKVWLHALRHDPNGRSRSNIANDRSKYNQQ
jgi:hypothetical protein